MFWTSFSWLLLATSFVDIAYSQQNHHQNWNQETQSNTFNDGKSQESQFLESQHFRSSHEATTEVPSDYTSLCGTSRTRVTNATSHILGFSERSGEIEGYADFTEQTPGSHILLIQGEVRGLTPGLHAIKITEFGNLDGGCSSAGDFFDNRNSASTSGESTDTKRYSGDLNDIHAGSDGLATFKFSDDQLSLNGVDSIIGRMVVVYEMADDYGANGRTGVSIGASESLAGNPRIACGVIGIQTESTVTDDTQSNTLESSYPQALVVPGVHHSDSAAPAGASPVANPSYNMYGDFPNTIPVQNVGVPSTTIPAFTTALSLFCMSLFIRTLY